jgi:hypothetical protein
MNDSAPDRCGAEGIPVIRDQCSKISDTKVRIADGADVLAGKGNDCFSADD